MRALGIAVSLWLPIAALGAAEYDNEAGHYTLAALPDPAREAQRMDRQQLSDQQPAGRSVRRGETLTIDVAELPAGYTLKATIGFLPMWNSPQTEQVQPLVAGSNRVRANQDGPLFFRLTAPPARGGQAAEVDIDLDGGTPLPLYVDGEMDADDWQNELSAHEDAPFVQLLGEHALITLPMQVYTQQPIDDPAATLAAIEQMIAWEDELAGFDGRSRRDQRTPLRMHYLVDFRASARDREGFYMYATDQFIGMLDHNTGDLTDPERLRESWGIWHETGHTQQQNSWTFDAIVEVNVNLFSLYVQEAYGGRSQLELSEDGDPTILAQARQYLEHGPSDFLADDNEDLYFIKLVPFYQLKEAYGWALYQDLHKHFRAHPLPEDASDQDKADAMVEALCELTGTDLREFFERWGLTVSDEANGRMDAERYPEPDQDWTEIGLK